MKPIVNDFYAVFPKLNTCTCANFFLHICKVFATGLVFERYLAPRSRFFEKVNGLGTPNSSKGAKNTAEWGPKLIHSLPTKAPKTIPRGKKIQKTQQRKLFKFVYKINTSTLLTLYHVLELRSFEKTHIFPRTRELPQFPISPKPLFLSKNRLRNSSKRLESLIFAENFFEKKRYCFLIFFLKKKSCFSGKKIFATELVFERFLAPRSRFFEKVNEN
ncbi:hypothetical protein LXL04_034752 [Taraxacum kok-saghyz]